MLNAALIQVEEAERELSHFVQRVELDPERLQEVEDRLTSIYDLARKHRTAPEQLPDLKDQLNAELDALAHVDVTGGHFHLGNAIRCRQRCNGCFQLIQ